MKVGGTTSVISRVVACGKETCSPWYISLFVILVYSKSSLKSFHVWAGMLYIFTVWVVASGSIELTKPPSSSNFSL